MAHFGLVWDWKENRIKWPADEASIQLDARASVATISPLTNSEDIESSEESEEENVLGMEGKQACNYAASDYKDMEIWPGVRGQVWRMPKGLGRSHSTGKGQAEVWLNEEEMLDVCQIVALREPSASVAESHLPQQVPEYFEELSS